MKHTPGTTVLALALGLAAALGPRMAAAEPPATTTPDAPPAQ
jgi:hypothetical protein